MSTMEKVKAAIIKAMFFSESHTEQGVVLLLMFISDACRIGLDFVKQITLAPPQSKKEYFFKRENELAVSSSVANTIKEHFHTIPTYILDEYELTERLLREKMLSDLGTVNFVGFDCEWVNNDFTPDIKAEMHDDNNEKSSVALLQICTASECLLIRLCKLKNYIPHTLKEVLESKRILKFGVGIDEDCKRLRSFGIHVCGAVDLRFVIQRCLQKQDVILNPDRIIGLSLKSLAASILGIEIEKSYKIRCSNWEVDQLSRKQIIYAANDAVVGLQIFLALCAQKVYLKDGYLHEVLTHCKDTINGRKLLFMSFLHEKVFSFYQSSLSLGSCSLWEEYPNQNKINDDIIKRGASFCQGITDLAFRNKNKISQKIVKKSASDAALIKATKCIPVRKKPLYHNCLLVAPDGTVLCTCDKKKADWYVVRDIGKIIKEDPFTVQLQFHPSGRPFEDRDYYTIEKENRCVVCGREDEYVKKMIVPKEYRRHFPSHFKDHLSHDVLLLCVICHRISEVHDMQLKRKLAQQHNVPVEKNKSVENPVLKRVKSAAKALLNNANQIPEKRKTDLVKVLQDFTKQELIDESKLQNLARMDTTRQNDDYNGTHGEQIVARLSDAGKLKEFIKMWREHFLENMNPRFLPPLWSTMHNLNKFEEY